MTAIPQNPRLIDMSGMVLGYWTVVSYAGTHKGQARWHCRCRCGTTRTVYGGALRSGESQSCGCMFKEPTKNFRTIDLTGKTFGRWAVVGCAGRKNKRVYWDCRCECGTTRAIEGSLLRYGKSQSCGCLQRELLSVRRRKHSMCDTPEYRCWSSMLTRCRNPKSKSYNLYGGRGIHVCKRWLSFSAFLKDMGPRPTPQHTIGRINPDKGYTPGNCEWQTPMEQGQHRRDNRNITCGGVTRSLKDWSERVGLPRSVIRQRLGRGWSEHDAIYTPYGRSPGAVV